MAWFRRSGRPLVRTWALLTEAGTISSLAVVPYALELQASALEAAARDRAEAGKPPLGPTRIALATALNSHIVFGGVVAAGLRAGRVTGLGAPYLERLVMGDPVGLPRTMAVRWLIRGTALGAGVAALDKLAFRAGREQLAAAGLRPPAWWRGLLAVPYGALGEEILMRLGAQTVAAAGIARLRGERHQPPGPGTMIPAIAISSTLFAAAHLPAARAARTLTPAIVARTFGLNALPGGVLGVIYWRRGLECAMLTHAGTAFALTVVTPAAERLLSRPDNR